MARKWIVLTAVVALVPWASDATSAAPAPPCSRAAAKHAILASAVLKSLWPTLRLGGGVSTLLCHDLTRDGAPEMAVTVFSGGTAGDTAWVVFRRQRGAWRPALRNLAAYKVGLYRVGTDLVESQPVYLANDPNCCPTGGFDHRRFRWNGSRFVVVKRWHSARFHP